MTKNVIAVVPCDDAISRQAVKETIFEQGSAEKLEIDFAKLLLLQRAIKSLPSVTPQPKTGHWEWIQYDYDPKLGDWHCSECRSVVIECVDKNDKGGIPLYKYCPQCGTKIQEVEN